MTGLVSAVKVPNPFNSASPQAPKPVPLPRIDEAKAKAAADDAMRRRRGRAASILSPQTMGAAGGEYQTAAKRLLG